MDYGKLEVIVLHKPDLNRIEVGLLLKKGYCDKIKDTLFKVTTHKGIAAEERMLVDLCIDVSYETTGWNIKETSKYLIKIDMDKVNTE